MPHYEILLRQNHALRLVIEAATAEEARTWVSEGQWHEGDVVDRDLMDSVIGDADVLTPKRALQHEARQMTAAKTYRLSSYTGETLQELVAEEFRLWQAAPELLDTLCLALQFLNAAPRSEAPGLNLDSYSVAALCERSIKAAGGAA